MSGLSFDTVRTLATFGWIGFAGVALVAGILLKSIAQKLAFLAIFGLLALLVWTQRASLETCAEVVRAAASTEAEATCTFFGLDITVPGLD